MDRIRSGLSTMWDRFFGWLPQLVGAIAIVIITYIIAKIFQSAVVSLLARVDFDRRLHEAHGGAFIQRAFPAPGRFLGRLVFWLLFLSGLSIALTTLGIPVLSTIIEGIYKYLPNVIAAMLIFLVASAVSAATGLFINRTLGDTPTGKVAGAALPVVIMSVAAFMILEQLKIAPAVVTITYTALVGSLFLGLALAFGLGGREVAATILQNAYEAGQEKRGQIKRDLEVSRRRTRQMAKEVKTQARRRAA
jgi:hypothetical protein